MISQPKKNSSEKDKTGDDGDKEDKKLKNSVDAVENSTLSCPNIYVAFVTS